MESHARNVQMKFSDYFASVPVLETARCVLRPFERADMDDYFEILQDEEVLKYLGGAVQVVDREPHISNWLNNINGRLLKVKKVFTWCIEHKETARVIGRIDLGGFVKQSHAEIAYHFSRDFWGDGIATEVVGCVTDFGVNRLRLHRIQGLVRVENIASQRVLLKNQYQMEGVLKLYPFGKEFHDAAMFALVKEENLKR